MTQDHSDTKNMEEILKFSKPRQREQFQNFKNEWEVKKSKCENHIKWGIIICKMMRGFQIWTQNSNRITFDPLFGQKTVKNGLNGYLTNFRVFFWPKRGSDVIRFEFRDQIWNRITFDPFWQIKCRKLAKYPI